MGFNIQSTYTQDTINEVTDIVNQQVTTNKQNVKQDCNSFNLAKVELGGLAQCGVDSITIKGVNVTIDQIGKSTCKIDATNNITVTQTQLDQIKDKLSQKVQNDIQNKQGWLAVATDIQSSVSITEAQILNDIKNIQITDIEQTCNNSINQYNQGEILICANVVDSNIAIDQSTDVYAVTQCVTTGILTSLMKDKVFSDVAQETDNKLSSKQEGISSLFIWIFAIIGILLFLAFIGLIIYAVSGGSSSKPKEEGKKNESAIETYLLNEKMSGGSNNAALVAALESDSAK
jgi:hypothetical protein